MADTGLIFVSPLKNRGEDWKNEIVLPSANSFLHKTKIGTGKSQLKLRANLFKWAILFIAQSLAPLKRKDNFHSLIFLKILEAKGFLNLDQGLGMKKFKDFTNLTSIPNSIKKDDYLNNESQNSRQVSQGVTHPALPVQFENFKSTLTNSAAMRSGTVATGRNGTAYLEEIQVEKSLKQTDKDGGKNSNKFITTALAPALPSPNLQPSGSLVFVDEKKTAGGALARGQGDKLSKSLDFLFLKQGSLPVRVEAISASQNSKNKLATVYKEAAKLNKKINTNLPVDGLGGQPIAIASATVHSQKQVETKANANSSEIKNSDSVRVSDIDRVLYKKALAEISEIDIQKAVDKAKKYNFFNTYYPGGRLIKD